MMKSFGKLHQTQERLLRKLAELKGEPLSLRELGRRIGISSPNTVSHHLKQLQQKGYLVFHEDGRYEINSQPVKDVVYLPLYGNVACGPVEFYAEENIEEYIPLPTRPLRIGENYFLVRARGQSMEPMIGDKDLLLVKQGGSPENGEIVLIALNDGVFAKKFYKGQSEVVLQSLNQKFEPIVLNPADTVRVLGKVRGILRGTVK